MNTNKEMLYKCTIFHTLKYYFYLNPVKHLFQYPFVLWDLFHILLSTENDTCINNGFDMHSQKGCEKAL